MTALVDAFDELVDRRVILFGGKGGVGKTTISTAAALHYAQTRSTILFTTDPASNLRDLLGETPSSLRIEELDAHALYTRFLDANLEAFLEIGDRGTYLDREEMQRLLELSIPGIDELMAWMHIGELAEANRDSIVVVDTAPTGHTLRMLSSSEHFHQLAQALDAMQEKHRAMVAQFTRRSVADAMDQFIDDFDARAKRRRALLTTFVPVTLEEPLVVEQTLRLIASVGLEVPFVILNRARGPVPAALAPWRVVEAPRSCVPLDSAEKISAWSAGVPGRLIRQRPALPATAQVTARDAVPSAGAGRQRSAIFFAGKGGVGKTSCSASVALQLAHKNPDKHYVAISVDPAHSLLDLQIRERNLTIEAIDTKAKWRRFRDTFGSKIEAAVDALTPRGMSMSYDTEAMLHLIEIAPPGADELFAITRLADLTSDENIAGVIVDTAPTGHFLRLLDLPKEAGEWVREFMRILLRYRDLIPAGSLGEELVRASRALKELDATLRSDKTEVIVVTRPERIVIAETERLIENLRARGIHLGEVIANYVTPANGDECDQSMRAYELEALERLENPLIIERRDRPPSSTDDLLSLVPIE
ncbi:MAG TPA: ArsA family ATPase [Thermoanaerobaculia bacterium]|nr:ArsA family ATPase [Thermoanaerobaculia bacterium]